MIVLLFFITLAKQMELLIAVTRIRLLFEFINVSGFDITWALLAVLLREAGKPYNNFQWLPVSNVLGFSVVFGFLYVNLNLFSRVCKTKFYRLCSSTPHPYPCNNHNVFLIAFGVFSKLQNLGIPGSRILLFSFICWTTSSTQSPSTLRTMICLSLIMRSVIYFSLSTWKLSWCNRTLYNVPLTRPQELDKDAVIAVCHKVNSGILRQPL